MSRFEMAVWRPLGTQTEPRLVKKHKILIHTMVGTLEGTDSMFRKDGFSGVESHFGTSDTGVIWQWQDTDFQADANLEGNDDAISIENEDWFINNWKGVGPVPPFTDAQVDSLVDLCAEICLEHDIPPVRCPDSEDASKGIGTHRLGIDPFRTHGEHYTTSFGKVCPGDARLRQVNEIIIPRTAAIVRERLNPVAKTPWITAALVQNQEYRAALREIRNTNPAVQELEESARRRAWQDFVALKEFQVK